MSGEAEDRTRQELSALVPRLLARDREAAREAVAALHPLVLRIVRAHRPRSMGEEDLVQEVFLKVLSRVDRYRPVDGIPFEHWVSRVAVRTCLDALRSERRRPVATAEPLSPPVEAWLARLTGQSVAAPDDVVAARDLVGRLLGSLAPRDRLVLTLLDLEERSVAEVSRMTGWSPTLVKVRAFRARGRLRSVAAELAEGGRR